MGQRLSLSMLSWTIAYVSDGDIFIGVLVDETAVVVCE